MRRRCRRLLIALLSLPSLLPALGALGQSTPLDCDASNLRPIGGASGYTARRGDSRCEGVYQSPVSATGLEVISVTLGPLDFDVELDDHLVVSMPDLGALDADAIRVRAVALPLRTYYRMDTLVAPGQTMRWPVGAVLRPWDLTSDRLGVFGWIDHAGDRVLVPVAVNPEDQSSADDASRVLIKLRSPVRLDRVVWREVADDGSVSDWRPVVERTVRGGEAIAFKLPAGPAGVLRLDFRARRPNSDYWLALDLRIWRPTS